MVNIIATIYFWFLHIMPFYRIYRNRISLDAVYLFRVKEKIWTLICSGWLNVSKILLSEWVVKMEVFVENFPPNQADLTEFHSKSYTEGQNGKNNRMEK